MNPIIGQGEPSFKPAQSLTNTNIDSPQPSHLIGNRYLLNDYVGSGTRGEIYEAVDQQISKATGRDQLVSIEILALRDNQVPLVNRFASQFSEIVNLPHPNIARSMDFGVSDDTVFFTMELLEGTSLRSMLDGNSTEAFSENEVMAVINSTADALTFIHKNGFTHGNLTPDSIFITQDFDVKIVDFASEVLKQSFDIMASRQTGSSKPLKPVEDVYGLAAIAYEMLTGEPPYDGTSRTQARRKGSKLRAVRRLSRNRRNALTRALALRFDKRTPTVAEFAEEFGITGQEILHVPASRTKTNANRILKPLAALVAIAAAAALLQPNYGVIEDKLSDLTSLVASQFVSSTPEKEPVIVATKPSNISTQDEIRTTEAIETEPTLSAQVVQSLESEIAEYIAQDDQPSQNVSAADNSASIDSELVSQLFVTDLASTPPSKITRQVESEPTPESSRVIEAPQNEESVEPQATQETPSAADVVFERPSLTVRESQSMAAISLRRNGDATQSAQVIWWTGENTARTDLDYAELGVRTEYFSAGQDRMTVYVPIISDSVSEGTESFYVYAQSNLASKSEINALEVIVVDDDG